MLRRCGCAGRHLLMYSFLVSLYWYQHAATCNMTHKQVKGLAAAGTSLHNVDLGRQQSLKDQTDRLPASGASCGTMTLQHTTLTTFHTTLHCKLASTLDVKTAPGLPIALIVSPSRHKRRHVYCQLLLQSPETQLLHHTSCDCCAPKSDVTSTHYILR